MANEKANQHAELLPADVNAGHIFRLSTNTASGNFKIFLSKIWAYFMIKSVYDTNGDGIVNAADTAATANVANSAGTAGEAATLSNGQTASAVMVTDGLGNPSFQSISTFIQDNVGKKIVGLISQVDADSPTLVIMYNNTGLTLTPARVSDGVYTLSPNVAFVQNETYFSITINKTVPGNIYEFLFYFSSGELVLKTADLGIGLQDGILDSTPFTIEIYT